MTEPVRLIDLATTDGLRLAPYEDIRRGRWPYWMACEETTWRFAAVIKADGIPRIYRACTRCDLGIGHDGTHNSPGSHGVKLDYVATHIAIVEVLGDHRWHNNNPCEHCGNTNGTQLHHWAPRRLFPNDADNWPTSWLCTTCHTQWHQTIRNHQ